MGVYHATGDDRHLSVCEASTPRRGGSVHDVFGSAHRARVVVLVHHGDAMGVGGGVPVHGRGEGIGGEVWRGIQSISSAGADAVGEPEVCGQSSGGTP